MGKPVITTESEHCSAAVDDGVSGILVPIRNSDALAKAIEKITTSKSLADNYGINSRKKSVDELDENKIISDLVMNIL